MTVLASLLMIAAAPITIAGGQIDPAFPDADIYLAPPPPGEVPPGRACRVAQRYLELVNSGDYHAIVDLFADDAAVLEPMRATARGRAEIDAFYSRTIGPMRPRIVGVSYSGDDKSCYLTNVREHEIAGQKRYALASVNHFLVNAKGKVVSMVAFSRPAPIFDRPGTSGH